MKTLTEEDIDKQLDAVKAICKTLLPLSERARRRIMDYLQDEVTDTAGDLSSEFDILKRCREVLGLPK